MRRFPRVVAALTGFSLPLAAIAGCASRSDRTQQFAAMESALGSRYMLYWPSMISHATLVGTEVSTITGIRASSPQSITLISAALVALPGFQAPQLISIGVIAGHCPRTEVLLPPTKGQASGVLVNGHKYQPLPLRGTQIEIGGGCFAQLIYVVRATSAGQYAAAGLRVLVRRDGHTETMYGYAGTDIWYYGSGPLPSGRQVTNGLRDAFAAQVAFYRSSRLAPPALETEIAQARVLVPVGTDPVTGVVVPLVGEPDRNPVAVERPQLLDQPMVEFP